MTARLVQAGWLLAAWTRFAPPHGVARVYQERPGEFSWECFCGAHYKRQAFGSPALCFNDAL